MLSKYCQILSNTSLRAAAAAAAAVAAASPLDLAKIGIASGTSVLN
jgi:hypothetical protein